MDTSTILDVAAILGLPLVGKHLHVYVDPMKHDLCYVRVAKGVYSNFIKQNAKMTDSVIDGEHTAFLMYFFRKFFYGTTFVGIVQELQPYIVKMLSGDIYHWGPLFMACMYKGMYILLEQMQRNNQINKIQCPIYFLQLSTQYYFKNFMSPLSSITPLPATRTLGPQLAATPIKPLSPLEVVRALFLFNPTEEDWCPVSTRGIGQRSIFDALLPDASLSPEERKAVVNNWCQVLVAKDLVIGYRGSTQYINLFAEYYFPNYVARQLGLTKHVPMPYKPRGVL